MAPPMELGVQAPAGMGKSQSVPGLLKLGTTRPKLEKNHRTGTLSYHLDSAIDKIKPSPPSHMAKSIVQELQDPRWRITAQQATAKVPEPDPLENVAGNMKHPRVSPAWLKHDRHVLRFNGFFQEGVNERNEENCRYRHCVIFYFLEDGTVRVGEPKIENSGLPQGALIKRHRIPKADGSGYVGIEDLGCGRSVELYSKVFFLQSCDRYTRWFYEQSGVDVGADEEGPQDTFEVSYKFNKTAEKNMFPTARNVIEQQRRNEICLGGPQSNYKLQQFLENDRRILRFYAYWDDKTLYGCRVYFVFHFFLADNTVEISEAHSRNSGRDPFQKFYRRTPLLKENRVDITPGCLRPDPVPYMPQDFRIGESLNIWGRKVVLYQCDDFTQKFYEEMMSIDQRANVESVEEPQPKHAELHPPPHSGLGSEEDSLISCYSLMPKAPKQDLVRLMTLSGELLRFEARIANGLPEDAERKLIIGVFPADDTVAVWEVQKRNSGIMGGKFSERGLKKNPATNRYFVTADFAVGVVVTIAAQPLQIVRADEHTLQYMEQHPEMYRVSCWRTVARRLFPIRENLQSMCGEGISPDELLELARRAGIELLDHEVISLMRQFPIETYDGEPQIHVAPLLDGIF